jgi:uncharacterized protein YigE (DUF2233 family)
MRKILIALACLCVSLACRAGDQRFTVITVDTSKERLELFHSDESGKPFKRFDRLNAWLKRQNKDLGFAMNAGMYHADFSPVGLLVIDGKQLAPLNLDDGVGNFFLKPNGVFLVSDTGPRVIESSEYPALKYGVRIATQSGPLLLRNGLIHPGFNPKSNSRLIRNGVGVSGKKAFFVISEQAVTFHEIATFFRDSLHCPDALYLDGVVSSLYSTKLQRHDVKTDLGPMIGI